MTEADLWADRAFLRGNQYRTDANLVARQSIYAYQHPRIDLQGTVLGLAAPAPSDLKPRKLGHVVLGSPSPGKARQKHDHRSR